MMARCGRNILYVWKYKSAMKSVVIDSLYNTFCISVTTGCINQFFLCLLNYEYDISGCHLPKSVNTALLTATCAWALLFPVIYSRFRVCLVWVSVTIPSCRLASPIIAISGVNLVSALSVCTKCVFAKFCNVKKIRVWCRKERITFTECVVATHFIVTHLRVLICRNAKGNPLEGGRGYRSLDVQNCFL